MKKFKVINQHLKLTSSVIMLGMMSLLMQGCDTSSSNTVGTATNTGASIQSSPPSLNLVSLVYNGFNATADKYSQPLTLAGDLSATAPANLYLLKVYQDSLQGMADPKSYTITLPASKTQLTTTNTKLNPGKAVVNYSVTYTPSTKRPVILHVPAGAESNKEAPFFPSGARYTAVIAESPNEKNYTAIFSIESSNSPVAFGAFGHFPNKNLDLRFYDNASTIQDSGQSLHLSSSANPGTIQARFLALTSDKLPQMNLMSMDKDTFSGLGMTSTQLLGFTENLFPKLVDSSSHRMFFNPDYGIFCLGGKNTFETVDLSNQTFVYPMSPTSSNTTINTVSVSDDSGFIVESGKHLTVNNLQGTGANRTLNLIAVLDGSATPNTAVVTASNMSNINAVNVSIGKITPGFTLPTGGMVLMSYNGTAPTNVQGKSSHINGVFYTPTAEAKDQQIVLKSFTKGSSLGDGTVHRLLAGHPHTQGLSMHAMNSLVSRLDPMNSVQLGVGDASSAVMQHAIGLQLKAPCSAKQSTVSLANKLDLSYGDTMNHKVASAQLKHSIGGLGVLASTYGTSSDKEATFGSTLTAFSSVSIKGNTLIPSVAVGYSVTNFENIGLNIQNIRVNLNDAVVNSVFARLLTTFQHTQDNLSFSFAAGLEARHSVLSSGIAASDHIQFSVTGNTLNAVHSTIEATLASKSAHFKASIWNFNRFNVQFGFND